MSKVYNSGMSFLVGFLIFNVLVSGTVYNSGMNFLVGILIFNVLVSGQCITVG